MLDPLTALSLASSVVQFVDFGAKLISDGVELYEKGALSNHDELKQASRDLIYLTGELMSPSQATRSGFQSGPKDERLPKEELGLQQLASSCRELGSELISILEGLEAQESQNGLESFRKAIRSSWKKGKIKDVETRLKRLQDQLGTHLLFLLRYYLTFLKCKSASADLIISGHNSRVVSKLNDISEGILENEVNTSFKIDQLREDLLAAVVTRDEKQKERKKQKKKEKLKEQPDQQEPLGDIGIMCQNLAEESSRTATWLSVLNSLFFKAIKVRQTAVKEAHARTFEWIFAKPTDNPRIQTGFKNWLETGNGIFWVAGKAGSGKSTLMKYLCDHRCTNYSLQKWAGEDELVVASYYFWSAGNTLQKSQEGLLQSLLYQILRQCPQLIPKVCPSRWNLAINSKIQDPWTLQELAMAFVNLGNETRFSTRFCFFVDGLDEYDGEHLDIINVLRRFVSSPSFKLCVSSRPWNVFVEEFGGNTGQKMLLQDFTRGDITLYVKNKLEEDHRFLVLMHRDHRYKELIEDIVKKAEGVFLWVYLVVKSLLRGLTDDNDITTLKLRLDHLPPSLEQYFKQMLYNIEDVYQTQTAQIFQTIVHAASPLPAIAFHYLGMEKEDPNYAFKVKIQHPFEDKDVISISEKIRKHLNARCKDLIEVHHTIGRDPTINVFWFRVEFLHRTVRDFLMTKDMHDFLQSRSPAGFDANASLCRVSLALAKAYPGSMHLERSDPDEINLFLDLLFYAKDVETFSGHSEVLILDEIYRVLSEIWQGFNIEDFLKVITREGLHLYVAHKLDERPQKLPKGCPKSLLDMALGCENTVAQRERRPGEEYGTSIDVNMVRVLLERGVNPNGSANSKSTIWELFLHTCFRDQALYNHDPPTQIFQAAQLLIRHGANPDVKFKYGMVTRPSDILMAVLRPAQNQQISVLLTEKRSTTRSKRFSRLWRQSK
jgi:hypothetical protein